jgi:hypothetical protein
LNNDGELFPIAIHLTLLDIGQYSVPKRCEFIEVFRRLYALLGVEKKSRNVGSKTDTAL